MKRSPTTASIGLAQRIYALLLYLYPPAFRQEFGTQMRQDFALIYRSCQRRHWWQGVAFWMLIGRDLLGSLWHEYRAPVPQPRRWWWLRLIALISIGVGMYKLTEVIAVVTNAAILPLFLSTEWLVCTSLQTVGITLALSFGLWTLPVSGRIRHLVRGTSLLLAAMKLFPEVIWLIRMRDYFPGMASDVPIFGAGEIIIFGNLLPFIAFLAILTLGGICLRWRSHRWWCLSLLMIYLVPDLLFRTISLRTLVDYSLFWNPLNIFNGILLLGGLGWIFFGVKLWLSIPRRSVQAHVPVTH